MRLPSKVKGTMAARRIQIVKQFSAKKKGKGGAQKDGKRVHVDAYANTPTVGSKRSDYARKQKNRSEVRRVLEVGRVPEEARKLASDLNIHLEEAQKLVREARQLAANLGISFEGALRFVRETREAKKKRPFWVDPFNWPPD